MLKVRWFDEWLYINPNDIGFIREYETFWNFKRRYKIYFKHFKFGFGRLITVKDEESIDNVSDYLEKSLK